MGAAAAEEQRSKLPQVVLVARHVDRPWHVRRLHVAEPEAADGGFSHQPPAAEPALLARERRNSSVPRRTAAKTVLARCTAWDTMFRPEGISLAD